MKFLLDENFPVTAAAFIESCGHQAIPFLSACKSGDDDEAVFAAAQRQKAVILTSDRDFYHTIPLLHPLHSDSCCSFKSAESCGDTGAT